MPVFSANELALWTGGRWEGTPPASLRGVCNDTRTMPPGALYIALRGSNFDGHAFVGKALSMGAAGAMVAEGARIDCAGCIPLLRVPDTLRGLRDMARGHRRSFKAPFVGITGSVGKSTVKEMTAAVLWALGPVGRTLGNWNNEIGLPLSMLAMERDSIAGVFEAGMNHPGEIVPLCDLIAPSWGIVTNIAPVHTEFFDSLEGIAVEKAEMLRRLPRDGTAVLRRDDAFFGVLSKAAPCRVVTVSENGDADYTCSSGDGEAVILERSGGEKCGFKPPLPGRHNLANALFAAAVGRGFGIGWDRIRVALESYRPLPSRWNREVARGVTFIDDSYNASPLSMKAAIETFAGLGGFRRKWLVLGDMLELGRDEREHHEAIGRMLAGFDWEGLVVVGSRGGWIADGAVGAGLDPARVRRCADAAGAGGALAALAAAGDAVLLKASHGIGLAEARKHYVLLAV